MHNNYSDEKTETEENTKKIKYYIEEEIEFNTKEIREKISD